MDISSDGINLDRSKQVDFTNSGAVHTLVIVSQYMRIRITNNSGSNYTVLRAQTLFHRFKSKELTSTLTQTLTNSSDVQNVRATIVARNLAGNYNNINSDIQNNLNVNIQSPQTAFGELMTEDNVPVVQVDAIYGLLTDDIEAINGLGGTATSSDQMFVAQTGTSVGGFSLIRTNRVLHFNSGEGSMLRISALFTTGVANSIQLAGLLSAPSGLFFGYTNTLFGVTRRTDGAVELRKLVITSGASSGGNVSITLDDSVFIVPVTSGTIRHNAFEITEFGYGALLTVDQVEDNVNYLFNEISPQTGAFSFVDTDATGLVASFETIETGAAPNDTFTAQTSWNIDTCDGSKDSNNPSGFNLDPTKLNLYQIDFRFGAGRILFSLENSINGHIIPVHMESYTNSNIKPNFKNPNIPLSVSCASLGSTTNLTVKSASMSGFSQGGVVVTRNPRSFFNTKMGVTSTLTNILTIRSSSIFGSTTNIREFLPISCTFSSDGTKNVIIELITDAVLGGEPDWNFIEEDQASTEYDISGTTITNGKVVGSYPLGKTESQTVDLTPLFLRIKRNRTLTIAAQTLSSTSDISTSLIWTES